MADLTFLDDMIKKRIEHRKKNDLIPVCYIIPGYGFGCIDVKRKKYKDVKEVEINGSHVKLIDKDDPRNPLNVRNV
jgi:hypothetical protein